MTNQPTISTVGLKGQFTIRVKDAATGEVIQEINKQNLVCTGARKALLRLVSQQTTPDDYEQTKLWAIYCGNGTTPPVNTETALVSAQFKKAVDQPMTVDLTNGYVEVQMVMESGEGNGYDYTEVGLMSRGTADNPATTTNYLMYARQIHGAIPKTSAISIEYTWRLQILI